MRCEIQENGNYICNSRANVFRVAGVGRDENLRDARAYCLNHRDEVYKSGNDSDYDISYNNGIRIIGMPANKAGIMLRHASNRAESRKNLGQRANEQRTDEQRFERQLELF